MFDDFAIFSRNLYVTSVLLCIYMRRSRWMMSCLPRDPELKIEAKRLEPKWLHTEKRDNLMMYVCTSLLLCIYMHREYSEARSTSRSCAEWIRSACCYHNFDHNFYPLSNMFGAIGIGIVKTRGFVDLDVGGS